MRNFKLSNGDLVLGKSNRLEIVSDEDKLIQDLKCWLLEPYGTGFMTPNFGSFLEYPGPRGIVGRQIGTQTEAELSSEIDRILSLYQAAQQEKIKLARYNNNLNIFSRREILNRIKDIVISINGTRIDAYNVKITIETASGSELSMSATTGTEGVSIASS